MLPLIRKIASGMSQKDYLYLFILNCVCSIFMVIGYCSGCFINYNVFNLPSIMVYPLLGFGLDRENSKEHKILGYGLMILFSLCLIIPISLLQLRSTNSYAEFTDLIQCFTPVIAVGIFGLVKEIDDRYFHSAKWKKIMIVGGSTAFGIYLTEDIIRNQIIKLIVHVHAYDFVIAILYTLLTFIVGAAVVYLMKKVPVLKKIV